MNSLAGSILKTLGLTGSQVGGFVNSIASPPDSPQAQDRLFREFMDAGRTADPNIWNKYSAVMKRPVNFESMLQLWEEMSGWDLVAAALSEIVDEACQTDDTCPGTLWYECNMPDVEDSLNDMLERLDVETLLPSQVYHVAGLGNHFEKIQYASRDGVQGLSFVHPIEIRRYWLERNRRCIGYRWMGQTPTSKDNAWVDSRGAEVPRVALNFGSNNTEDLWYPWDFMHFRRLYRLRVSENGEPIFSEADGVYKKLRIAVDSMVVHRAQVQPDRYVVNIDVQDMAPTDQMRTVQRWKQTLRSKIAFGGQDTNDPFEFRSFYNPLALDTMLWMARPRGFQHGIEKLQGTANIPDVYDIELLTNLFFSVIGMPKSWLGLGGGAGEGGGGPISGKALMAQDMRFLRKIKSIRRPIMEGYRWLGYFHCLLQGKNLDELDIRVQMSPIGSLEDQLKLEVLKMQVEILDSLSDIMAKYELPREAWIETVFKKYMHLPDDIVNVFITSLPAQAPDAMESMSKSATTAKVLKEVQERLGNRPSSRLTRQIKDLLDGNVPDKNESRYKTADDVMLRPVVESNDRVCDSFGPAKQGKSAVGYSILEKDSKKVIQSINESAAGKTEDKKEPAYRQYIQPNA
jgi:hypothetical protein